MDAKLIGELIECCGYCINYLISSLQAMENEDIAECQKQSSQAKKLLSSAIGDVFTEVKELAEETDGTFDYPEASMTELMRQLSGTVMYAGGLLTVEEGTLPYSITVTSLVKAINTVTELYDLLYAND